MSGDLENRTATQAEGKHRCNCPHEVRAGCTDSECDHYAPQPPASPSQEKREIADLLADLDTAKCNTGAACNENAKLRATLDLVREELVCAQNEMDLIAVIDAALNDSAPSPSQEGGMREALGALLDRYVGLVNSGDAGNWDPETENEVIKARAALAHDGVRGRETTPAAEPHSMPDDPQGN